jgi:hypothetical protein
MTTNKHFVEILPANVVKYHSLMSSTGYIYSYQDPNNPSVAFTSECLDDLIELIDNYRNETYYQQKEIDDLMAEYEVKACEEEPMLKDWDDVDREALLKKLFEELSETGAIGTPFTDYIKKDSENIKRRKVVDDWWDGRSIEEKELIMQSIKELEEK